MRSCDVLARMLPRRAGISLRFRSRREHEFSLILDAVRIERSFPRSSFHPFIQDSRETRRITRSLFKEIRVGRRGAFRIDHRCVQRATRVQRNRSEIALEAKTHDPSVDPSDSAKRRRFLPPPPKEKRDAGQHVTDTVEKGKHPRWLGNEAHTRGEKLFTPSTLHEHEARKANEARRYVYVLVGRGMRHGGRSHTLRHPFTNAYWLISEDHGSLERNTPAEV